ncbi:DUF1311 domain-containing protein [Paenibacillus sp. ACRSA]|uniref:lysozyme inhibitor LprI family protein n=1 Tax=Paenibacillus sp. ACRSA TaxID=2918211 RepID=UPI001EF6C317|nr:lysozyme inhibitor LprI family protein [Paenibacillus sp. ACRSA]MCG7377377.1 DUF1311 domain-containing protein [Paenibacillus sp. ACRSA]
MKKFVFNATSSLLIFGIILSGCGSNNQGDSTINSSVTATAESTPEIIDTTEITEPRLGYMSNDLDSIRLFTLDANDELTMTLDDNGEFQNEVIYQENNNIRKIRSGLGYYMNIKISISGGTVTYTYKLRDDLSFGQLDVMKTQLEERAAESIDILQSALEPQIAIRMQDPVASVKFETKDGEVFYSQDSIVPGDAPVQEEVPPQGDAPVNEEVSPQTDTISENDAEKIFYLESIQYAEELIDIAPEASSYSIGLREADEAWDNELNRIYGLLRKKLSSEEMEVLKKDELAWIKARDKEVGDPEEVGVWTALEVRIRLTKERTLYLIDMYFDDKE